MKHSTLPLFTAAILFFTVTQVSAHATPTLYMPEAGSVVDAAPEQILIDFTERVEPNASSIAIFTPDGSKQETDMYIDPSAPRQMSAVFPKAGTGTYTIRWQVVSADDGHFTTGAFTVSLGELSKTNTGTSGFQIRHTVALLGILATFIELIGMSLLLGMILFYFMRKSTSTNDAFLFKRYLVIGSLLVILGSLLVCVNGVRELQQARADSVVQLFIIFATTTIGLMAFLRVSLAASIIGICFMVPLAKQSSKFFAWVLIPVLLIHFLRVVVSHAAASTFLPSVGILITFVHLIAKGAWVGLLIVFVLHSLPKIQDDKKEVLREYFYLSKFLSICFGIAALTGMYIVWLDLKSFENLLSTHWGMQCVVLGFFGFLLLMFRLYHQCILQRDIVRHNGLQPNERIESLPVTCTSEAITGIAVLCATAVIMLTTPPAQSPQFFHVTEQTRDGPITLSQHAFEADQMLLEFPGTDPYVVTIILEEQSQGIGPIVLEAEKRFPGGFMFPISEFSVPGTWTVHLNAVRPPAYDLNASFPVPSDALTIQPSLDRSFDALAWQLCIIALLLTLLSLYTYWYSKILINKFEQKITSVSAIGKILPLQMAPLLVLVCTELVLFLYIGMALHHTILKTAFQQRCEANNDVWHESVPIRFGQVTSPIAVSGCMVGMGNGSFHIPDEREYDFLMRPSSVQLKLSTQPTEPKLGTVTMFVLDVQTASGGVVTELAHEHNRILHTIMIGEDLQTFKHRHPEDDDMYNPNGTGSVFHVHAVFRNAGTYLIAADGMVRTRPFSETQYLMLEGEMKMQQPQMDVSRRQLFDGYDVQLLAPKTIKVGQKTSLSYLITQSGSLIQDLEPYLSAPMHLAIVRSDLRHFQHTHGFLPLPFLENLFATDAERMHAFVPDAFGPRVDASITFPTSGTYVIFAEFHHAGKIVVTRFMVDVID